MSDKNDERHTSDESTEPVTRDGGTFKLPSHKIRVEVVDGPDRGLVVELPGPVARVGSDKGCQLVLKDPTVSRLHIVVRVENNRIRVIDADSRNGTAVDGVDVRDAYARPDASIRIGETTLRLRMLDDIIDLPVSTREQLGTLIGRSLVMRRIFGFIERVAPLDTTVLLEGESGTGKELIAEAIHEHSPRADRPFEIFDCAAAPATLIESLLFGHVKGIYTDAKEDRPGVFERADGGTLFLDEIGELPLDLQPKLLGVLQRRQVRRLGSSAKRRFDVRIIAATNRNLAREVGQGRFREDLYFRLAVIPIVVPPLRERLDDVPLLVRHFEQQLRPRTGSPPLPDEKVAELKNRTWKGNVRELRNAVERLLALGTFGPAGSTPASQTPSSPFVIDLDEPLLEARERVADAFERAYVEAALRQSGGNVTRAAEKAGVNRKFMHRAIRRFALRGDAEPDDAAG